MSPQTTRRFTLSAPKLARNCGTLPPGLRWTRRPPWPMGSFTSVQTTRKFTRSANLRYQISMSAPEDEGSLRSRQRLALFSFQPIDHVFRQAVQKFQKRGVGPAEADHVHFVAQFHVCFGRA